VIERQSGKSKAGREKEKLWQQAQRSNERQYQRQPESAIIKLPAARRAQTASRV